MAKRWSVELEVHRSSFSCRVWQEPVEEQAQPAGRDILVLPLFSFFVGRLRGRAKESGNENRDIQSGLENESAPCRHGVEESNKGADSLLVVNDLQNPHTYVSPEVRYESVRTAPDRVKTNAPPPAKLKEPITPIAESSVVGQESKELPVSCLEDLTLNDSIPPVTTYRSRKEKPEEYHPSGGGITVNSRPLSAFCHVPNDDIVVVEEESKGANGLLGVNGDLQIPPSYGSPVVGRKSVRMGTQLLAEPSVVGQELETLTLYPSEELTVKKSIPPVTPYQSLKEKAKEYLPSALFPSTSLKLPLLLPCSTGTVNMRHVLDHLEPLVGRMSAAGPSEVDVMMSNAKHISREVLKRLEALHGKELLHTDIKGRKSVRTGTQLLANLSSDFQELKAKLKELNTLIAEPSVVGQELKTMALSPSGELTVKRSITPVTTHQSLKEKPEEFHPSVNLCHVLDHLEPLVGRMSAAGPSVVDVMMSNAKHILREVLKRLEALHGKELVHTDIKEQSILLCCQSQCHCQDVFTCMCPRESKCEVVIIDSGSITREGAKRNSKRIPGSYGYRAPEAYSSSIVSTSLDVWAFGVVAINVFLGRDQNIQKKDAAALLNFNAHKKYQIAEVVITQLRLRDLLSRGGERLHAVALFVNECFEVDPGKRMNVSDLLDLFLQYGIEETGPAVPLCPALTLASFGETSVHFAELENIKSALCWINCTSSDCTGNGTFVSFKKEGCKRFYLITCIHIFLTEDEGKIRKQLKALQRILVARCSAATYVVANRPRNLELTAKEVLLDSENPAICFDQDNDLLVIAVKDPSKFDVKPLLLMNYLREASLPDAHLFFIMYFSGKGEVMFTMGPKHPNAEQGTFRYRCDTGEGASGAPVFYNLGGCFNCPILMGIHVRGSAEDVKPFYKVASLLRTAFRKDMKKL